jgi:hypothetical protein
MMINCEWVRIWKEETVTYLNIQYCICLHIIGETTENLRMFGGNTDNPNLVLPELQAHSVTITATCSINQSAMQRKIWHTE